MNKSESKYFNTANKIDEAFLDLLGRKDFEYITVKEICQKAGVNRSTFYLHYETVDDLLKECNEYVINKFLISLKVPRLSQKDIVNLPEEELNFVTPKYLVPWLSFIKENKKLFKTYINKFSTLTIEKNDNLLFVNVANPVFNKLKIAEKRKKYLLQFYLAGLRAVVKMWVKNDCKDEVEDVCKIIIGCINDEKRSV